jgi:hypothetical protein
MFAAAAGKSTLGIPQSVGKEFADADQGGKLPAVAKPNPRHSHMAQRSATGLNNTAVAKEFGVHKSTVGRALKKGFVSGGPAR